MTIQPHLQPQTQNIRFRHYASDDVTYVGEAQIDCVYGTGITDADGYTDCDEITVTLDCVYNENTGQEVFPYAQGFVYSLRADLECAAMREFYEPTESMKILPGEEESYFDGLVSLGKSEFAY